MATRIYGDPDRKPDGTITGFRPAWSQESAIDDLTEEIAHIKRGLDLGAIPSSEIHYAKERMEKGEQRLKEIKDSKPRLSDEDRNRLAKERERVAQQISDTLYTHSEMDMQYVKPETELKKWYKPTIELDPEQAKESGIELDHGKTGLKSASKYYRDLSLALDEDPDVERLRRPGKTVRYDRFTQEVPGADPRLPEHYRPEAAVEAKVEVPEIKANSTFEHKGIEVKVNKKKGGRPKGSKNKPKK